jgi:hypothetical protein
MLDEAEPVRVFNTESKERFNLHDAVVVGVVNEKHPQGVFNPETLGKLHRLTDFAKSLDGVVEIDVMSLSTVDNIEHTGPGTVSFDWLMHEPPTTQKQALRVRERAMRVPFLKGTLVSEDSRALSIYIPLEEKNLAHEVSTKLNQEISQIPSGVEQFHIAGLPVAEDTFGVEMFKRRYDLDAAPAPCARRALGALSEECTERSQTGEAELQADLRNGELLAHEEKAATTA